MRYLKSGTELGFEPRGPKLKTKIFFFNDLQIKKKKVSFFPYFKVLYTNKKIGISQKRKKSKTKIITNKQVQVYIYY